LHRIALIKSPAVALRDQPKVGRESPEGFCHRTVSVSGLTVTRSAILKIEGLSGRRLWSATARDEHRTDSEREDSDSR
jgi:hypothetical protein